MIPDINLIPKLEKAQTTSKYVYISLGVVSLLALAFFVWLYLSATGTISALQAQQTNLQLQRDQLQTRQTEINSTQHASIEVIIDYVDMVSYPVLPLIHEIEGLLPKSSYLRDYSFGVDSVTISADFETLSDVSNYLTRLINSEYFADVQLSDVSQFNLGNETGTETTTEQDFNILPRHSANFTLTIDQVYLASGGAR